MCVQSLAKQMKLELMLLETQWDGMPGIFVFCKWPETDAIMWAFSGKMSFEFLGTEFIFYLDLGFQLLLQ